MDKRSPLIKNQGCNKEGIEKVLLKGLVFVGTDEALLLSYRSIY